MKIALVHDYLSQDGGAERVLQAFHELWPEAPIFVLFHDRKKISEFSKDADVRQSFIAKMPFVPLSPNKSFFLLFLYIDHSSLFFSLHNIFASSFFNFITKMSDIPDVDPVQLLQANEGLPTHHSPSKCTSLTSAGISSPHPASSK